MAENQSATGGRVALSGFLYQLLASLERGTSLVLHEAELAEGEIVTASLVLEPERGGDLQVLGPTRIVEQFKTRSTGKPWTPAEVMDEVFPDLLKAADPAKPARYLFTTNSCCSLDPLLDFASRLSGRAVPDDPVGALDDTQREFRFQSRLTARGYFRRMLQSLPDAPDTPVRLWSLLAAFEVHCDCLEQTFIGGVDEVLEILVDHVEDVEKTRRALLGRMFELAAAGARIRAEELLMEVGCNPERLLHRRDIFKNVSLLLDRDLVRFGYRPHDDVRPSLEIQPSTAVTLLSGPSGNGKTWALAKLAREEARAGRLSILLPARNDFPSFERALVDRLWHSGGYDAPLPLSRVAARLRDDARSRSGYWLTVHVDDVQDGNFLHALIDADLPAHGIRLVISAQPRLARRAKRLAQAPELIEVKPFSNSQLKHYLSRHNRAWPAADDVAAILRRPIMASIYVALRQGLTWEGATEYLLVERFWEHATAEYRGQDDYRSDALAIVVLAGSLLGPAPQYPWPVELWDQHLKDEARVRLTATGLIDTDTNGSILMSHERFLNWAVAKYIEREVRTGSMSRADLVGTFERLTQPIRSAAGKVLIGSLGYVQLDVLWLLANHLGPVGFAEIVLDILARATLQGSGRSDRYLSSFVATLGGRAIGMLEALALRNLPEELEWWVPADAGRAIAMTGTASPDDARAALARLLGSESAGGKKAAIAGLGRLGSPQLLDQLWDIHLENIEELERTSRGERSDIHARKEASYAALAAGVRLEPNWIGRKLLAPDPGAPADQLLFLLIGLGAAKGRALWMEFKEAFRQRVRKNRRSLARAAHVFGDTTEVPYLERVEDEHQDFEMATRLAALSALAPDRALAYLGQVPAEELWPASNWWLPRLLEALGDRARDALRQRFSGTSRDVVELVLAYSHGRHLVDGKTYDLILDTLEKWLAEADQDDQWEMRGEGHLLRFVAETGRPDLLALLQARAGTPFEELVFRRAIRHPLNNSNWFDRDAETWRLILIKMAGRRLPDFAIDQLRRAPPIRLREALTLALHAATPKVRQEIRVLAAEPSRYHQAEHCLALFASALREPEALLAPVRGAGGVPLDTAWLFPDMKLSNKDLERARKDIEATDEQQRLGGIATLAFAEASDACPDLIRLLNTYPPESKEAQSAFSFVGYHNCTGPALAPALRGLMSIEASQPAVLLYASEQEDAAVRVVASEYFEAHPLRQMRSGDDRAAIRLLEHADSRAVALSFMRRLFSAYPQLASSAVLAILAREGDEAPRNALEERVERGPRADYGRWLSAVDALAKEDPDAAWESAVRQLETEFSPELANLLLKIDPNRAPRSMFEAAMRAGEPSGRFRAALLLRVAADEADLGEWLSVYLHSRETKERVAAIEIAKICAPQAHEADFRAALDEGDEAAANAALEALKQLSEQQAARQLLEALRASDEAASWPLLATALDACDPYLLSAPDGPLSVAAALRERPAQQFAARERLQTRQSERDRKLKDKDREAARARGD